MSTVWCDGTITVTQVNNTPLSPSVTIGFEEFELRPNPQLVEAGTTANKGTRSAPTRLKPVWRLKLPWDSENLPDAATLFREGNVLNFTWTVNPSASGGGGTVRVYTLASTTVGEVPRSASTRDIVRFEFNGEGGDLTYPT